MNKSLNCLKKLIRTLKIYKQNKHSIMKRSLVLLVMVMLAVAISANVFGQKSVMYVGDKSNAEISGSVEIYRGLIKDLEERKKNFEKGLKKMLRKPADNEFIITKTDSLINLCQDKIMALQDQLVEFTERAAGKDQQNIISLKSRNLPAMTDAIFAINYVNGKKNGALIENHWYHQVFVKIQGPGRWHTSFTLDNGKKLVVPISMPGRYVVSYTYGNTTKCVGKMFDSMNSDIDSKTGRRYAFLSEMPSR